MRVKVILNPRADQGRGQSFAAAIEAAAVPYGGLDIVLTEHPGHATELARQAAHAGYDVVAGAGGDGTISDVVNGLVQGGRAEVRLGIIPIGSGNDLAWGLGIPVNDVETAVKILFTGAPRTIDLARIDDDRGHYRIVDNNIGIGFDAIVVIETESITRIHGFLMYLLATLRTILFYYQTPRLEMRFDEEEVTQEALFVAFGVGRRGGGGFLLTPDARHDDNRVDSCTVNPVGRLTMLWMLLKVMKGTHVTSRHITMRQNQRIQVRSETPLPIHTDGEVFAYPKDNVQQVTITSLPAAIQVMTP